MKDLSKQYETTKRKSMELMRLGHVSDYLEMLLEVNKYERLLLAIKAN